MTEPVFVQVDLTEMRDEGVLLAANEAFFWPLGLALTWVQYGPEGIVTDLHIRQWDWGDNHREAIELAPNDPVGTGRRSRFVNWFTERVFLMPAKEARAAAKRMKILKVIE